jgi:lysophospholipase L1-like esterase
MTSLRSSGTARPRWTASFRTSSKSTLRGRLVIGIVLLGVGLAVTAIPATAGSSSTTPTVRSVRSYVALGDSFTSGPGVPVQLGPTSRPGAPTACMRSSDNYPSLASRALGLALHDVSCAGATTRDLSASQGPGIPAQLSALTSSTSLVSLGIGGNDLGFSTIAANCAAVTPWGATRVGWSCRSHYTVNGADQLAIAVDKVGTEVASSLREIRARAPHARVFVIGYPDILPPTGSGCWPKLPFSASDLEYLRDIETRLNSALAGDATAAHDVYVDTAAPGASHSACTAADSRWVAPVLFRSHSFPLHPTAAGMAGMALLLEQAFTSAGGR